jgi:D-cysteine desulfhydrase
MLPLFQKYPLLGEKLPYVSLGEFPTPVQKLDRFGDDVGVGQLYVKRDDLSGRVYGGNKIRKLEFLLGDALQNRAKQVVTFGYAGSNHALATAIYARQVGLRSISILLPQPIARYVGRNLLMSHHSDAELHHVRNIPLAYVATFYQRVRHRLRTGHFPRIVPPGGSSPLGTVGYVNAALELKKQITAGELPEPCRIYVALGTMGTVVGLMLGLKAAHLKSEVVPIRVVSEQLASVRKLIELFHKTNSFLRSLDSSFPRFGLSESRVDIRGGFLGQGYAHFTEDAMEAVSRMREAEGIKLEGTYTGKTLAALIRDADDQSLRDEVVLFWNTYNSRDLSGAISGLDYQQLPRPFHRYFEEDVQPLDADA